MRARRARDRDWAREELGAVVAIRTLDAEASSRGQGAVESARGHGERSPADADQEEHDAQVRSPTAPGPGARRRHRRLDGVEMGAWRAFLAASTSVVARLNHDLEAQCGISMREYEVLVRLSEAPDYSMRMSALAEDVSYSRSRLTHTVGRLEKEGFVARVSCSSDGRGVNCELTRAGLRFLRQVAPVHLEGVRRHVLDRLDRDQLKAMGELMSLIAEEP